MNLERGQDYISLARDRAKVLWEAYLALKAMQEEWQALDYGTTLPDGKDANAGYTKDEVGAVVFATTDALTLVFQQGHATNLTNLL